MPLLQGWDEGVAGMKVGGERLLIVPPSLGYGKRKMGDIPSNSTLRFGEPIGCPLRILPFGANRVVSEVKLLDIK
jgi:FKBP-type peptidyl-prolyl cis-trans isomerase 2